MEAKVLVLKCGMTKKSYGVRIQKMADGDWKRTWAFPLREEVAKREGYDQSTVSGSLSETDAFPGCPYCGNRPFYQCGTCHKIVCWNPKDLRVTCPWCNVTSDIEGYLDRFTVDTNTF